MFTQQFSILVADVVNSSLTPRPFTIQSPFDKISIKGHFWPVIDGRAIAVLLIVHGSGEHSRRYDHVVHFFTQHKIACVTFDWRGHGISEGERGFIPSINAMHNDLEEVIQLIRNDFEPERKLAIFAHGTGSALCLSHFYLRQSRPLCCQAIIINTPSFCLKKNPNRILVFISRAFANLDPNFRLPVEGNYKHVYTNDPHIVEAYRNDPLIHDRWPSMTISILLEIGALLQRNKIRLHCPLLVQHGGSDTVTPVATVEKWFNQNARGDKMLKIWPLNLHELYNDLNRDDIFEFVLEWLKHKFELS